MKKALFVIIICLALFAAACAKTTQSLEIVEIILDSGKKSTAIVLTDSGPIIITVESELRIKFNQPLSAAYKGYLGKNAELVAADTARLILPAKDSEVIIPQSLKSASGAKLVKTYSLKFTFTPQVSSR